MWSPKRRIARALLVVCALSGSLPASDSPRIGATNSPHPTAAAEVRLRKLHLVRPDLIPYPIAYEVYC